MGYCHAVGEGEYEFDIVLHLLRADDIEGIVTVMYGCGFAGRNSRKGDGGDALIRKRRGIARINALIRLYLEAELVAEI